jgi:hypothetical protein
VSDATRFSVRAVTFDDGTASVIHSSDVDGEYVLHADYARLKAEVERLTKAVMHSPAAQLKLKELEGKTTYEEINGKIPPCIDKYEAK